MDQPQETLRLQVASGGDPLRAERLTESLQASLAHVENITIQYESNDSTPSSEEKGGALTDLTLVVAFIYGARAVADVLVSLIREWASRERARQVRVTKGKNGISVEISGNSNESQREILDRLFGTNGDDT